ncbi:MAG: protein kinase domain-containing protein [Nannocystaceae bacterium]
MTQPPSVERHLAGLRAASDGDEARLHRAEVRERLFGGGGQGGVIDRYRIVRRIGKGGGGIVYEATDPHMDRPVALKLLGRLGSTAQEHAFLRESMMLAQVEHDAVVRVYDAGVCEAGAYIVMELVEGATMADWLDQDAARRWPQVLRMLIAAGEGLAACHHQAILHTDFKPSNVGLDARARPKLLDFGLARTAGASTGSFGGTPPYMPPEQFEPGALDERADLYAFCVTSFRALWGRMPFPGRSVEAQLRAKRAGQLVRVPDRAGVPERVRRVIERGLSARPDERPCAVQEVLEVYRGVLASRRRRVGVGVASAAAAALGVSSWLLATAVQPDACTGADAAWAGVYGSEDRGAIAEQLVGVGRDDAGPTADRVVRDLDAYGERWRAEHQRACEAASTRDGEDTASWDARVACIDDRRREAAAVVEVLATRGGEAFDRARVMVDGLTDPQVCADPKVLAAEFPPVPEAIAAEVDRIRDAVARAGAQTSGGFPRSGVEAATRAVAEARDVGHPPTLIHALITRAVGRRQMGETAAAIEDAREALVLSLASDRDRDALRSATLLFGGSGSMKDGERRGYLSVASALLGHGRPSDVTRYLNTLGLWQWHADDLAEAAETFTEAARSAEETGSGAPGIPRTNLAMVLSALRRHDEAIAAGRSAVRTLQERRGAQHPSTLAAHNALGTALRATGRYAEALEHLEILARGRQARLGPQSTQTIAAQLNAAWVRGDLLGREHVVDEFEALLERLEAHPQAPSLRATIALGRSIMARGLVDAGRYAEAETELREALASLEAERGPEHPNTATARVGLARALLGLHRTEEAYSAAAQAVTHLAKRRDPDHDQVLDARNALAMAYLQRDEPHRARAELERVAGFDDLAGEQALLVDEARIELARLDLSARSGAAASSARARGEAAAQRIARRLGAEHPRAARARQRWDASVGGGGR